MVLIGGSLAVLATVAYPGSEQATRLDPGALGRAGLGAGRKPTGAGRRKCADSGQARRTFQ